MRFKRLGHLVSIATAEKSTNGEYAFNVGLRHWSYQCVSYWFEARI